MFVDYLVLSSLPWNPHEVRENIEGYLHALATARLVDMTPVNIMLSFRLNEMNGEIPLDLVKKLGDTSIAFADAHSTRYDKKKIIFYLVWHLLFRMV